MNFIEIQSWPEVPQIGFFTSLFSSAFNLPDFDIEDLEEALLLDSSESNTIDNSATQEFAPRLIPDLIVALLKGCDLLAQSWPNITASNFQMFLRRIFRHKCEEYDIENPFNTDVDFHSLSLRTKVVILNYLCEFRLDSADVELITNNIEADSLRIQPLGFDSNESVYWYFFGTRLYREDFKKATNSKQKQDRIWQVICFTEEDWHSLANKFKNSKSRKEQSLYKCLVEDFLPNIPVIFKAKEAERRRRRTSSRVKSLLERQKLHHQLNSEEPTILGATDEDSGEKLSINEKYLEEKKQELNAKSKIRERIQHERALRAQRRSSSISSKSSSSSNKASSTSHEDSEDYDEVPSLNLNSHVSFNNHNKENILIKKKSDVKKLASTNAERVEQSLITKMPPVKLPGRQTNNSLSSITGNIVIQTPAATAPPPPTNSHASSSSSSSSSNARKKPNTKAEIPKNVPAATNSKFMETDEVLQIGMHKVLQQVKNHDDAWPFMDPVEEDIAPRYYSIIKRPMDLMKMEEKLDNGEYQTFAEFRTDFKLIVNNCRLYNGQNNEYTHMVNNLQIAFDRATKKYFDQNSSDEEQVLLEYPPIIEPVNKVKGSTVTTPTSKTVQKSEDKKSKHNNSSNKNKKVKSDSSSNEDEEEEVVEKSKKKSKKKEEKKVANVKEKSTVGRKRKREKDESENVTKSKKAKKNSDHEDIKDIDSVVVSNKKLESKKNKKNKEKNVVLKELKSNKKSKKKLLLESNNTSPTKSPKKQSKQSKKNNNSSSSTPVKVSKSEKEKLKNNHSNKYYDSSDIDSDNESIRDLITENYDDDEQIKFNDNHNNKSTKKKKNEKDTKKSAKLRKHKKSKGDEIKLGKYSDDAFSMSDSERSINPSITNNDFDSSFERKEFSEIKDKFDLIKERRNKNSLPEKTTPVKESGSSKKEKISHKEKHSKEKKKDDKLSIFDQLLAETKSPPSKQQGSNNKSKSEAEDEKPSKKHSKKEPHKSSTVSDAKQINSDIKQKGNKKQKQASLDVLDMETEQTLKDINKWLEHTPRFEYSSASNSPSRYVIEDIDMHSKIDDTDFRKPIPLMPSSPSTSNKVFQSSLQKDDKILKDTNNKGLLGSPPPTTGANANAALNKKGLKEPKRKKSRDKLQPLPKKKEIQRTIDRLQPGKTKGNLLTNIQNINKPEELFPLGNREKIKEIKSSLTVETDESSPKLSLGKVLDASAFNMCDPKLEKECFSDNEPNDRKSLSESSIKGDDMFVKSDSLEKSPKESEDVKPEAVKTETTGATSDSSASATKPNLNAWFKAFGVPKKPKNTEDTSKKFGAHDSKIESSYTSSRQRKLSTGSSMSERSSVEDSPQVGLDERGGAPAPFPSPIGASPMSVTASPKPDESINQKSNYPINSSTRVGFYQDTTSTKSSPDKSCSPREMLSPYHGHYSQQSNVYNSTANSGNSNAYSNFYNPENSNKQRQTNYSKPTNSPTPYYDQYKQPMSQDSDFNNSMSPNTNPNSPYHSQQSSPYQQQPNSPYQQPANSSGNNIIDTRSPNSPYSQPNSPYQQANQAASPFNTQANQTATQGPTTAPQSAPTQPPNFNNQQYNALFNQSTPIQGPEVSQFPSNTQQQPQQQEPKVPAAPTYNVNMQQQSNASNFCNTPLQSQQHQTTAHAATKSNPNLLGTQNQQSAQQSIIYPDNSYADQNKSRNYSNKKPEPQQNLTAPKIPNESASRFPAEHKVDENPKYLDLSKQASRQHPQYQQPPAVSANAYSKPEYDKSQSYEMLARSMQKTAAYGNPMESCAVSNELSYDARQKIPNAYGSSLPNANASQTDSIKDLTKATSAITNLMQSSTASNLMHPAHQSMKTTPQPNPMDYKQSPLFNSSPASSMMELTAFMRDFRQAEDRFSNFPNPSSGFYDKPITPSHMFAKNIVSSASTLQQMFSNPAMTTMAYGREQQEYQNRLNAFQAAANTSQSASQISQLPVESKAKKSKKSKKNPSPEISASATTQHPAMSQHQMPSNQQQSHQQFAMHQQSFQSFAGLKIPSAGATTSTDPMKSVVPGSAFNYGPTPLGLYGENSPYLDEFQRAQGSYYPPPLRSTAEAADKSTPNPPQAHPAAPSSPYHHLLPSHHPPRSYPFMNSIDPATLQQQYRMMFNQTYQAGYLGMHHNQPPWHM